MSYDSNSPRAYRRRPFQSEAIKTPTATIGSRRSMATAATTTSNNANDENDMMESTISMTGYILQYLLGVCAADFESTAMVPTIKDIRDEILDVDYDHDDGIVLKEDPTGDVFAAFDDDDDDDDIVDHDSDDENTLVCHNDNWNHRYAAADFVFEPHRLYYQQFAESYEETKEEEEDDDDNNNVSCVPDVKEDGNNGMNRNHQYHMHNRRHHHGNHRPHALVLPTSDEETQDANTGNKPTNKSQANTTTTSNTPTSYQADLLAETRNPQSTASSTTTASRGGEKEERRTTNAIMQASE